ncbi:MAG: 30S ribosomal protein S8 [SAR324 cluster bacterium]|nr:30S ribosomal protein S8 [SAR324 cluster bacterium]
MSMTDPIADFLTHIRNALMRKHASVESPSSKIKTEIARVLKEEGFIVDWNMTEDEKGMPRIAVELKYDKNGESVIRGIKRISKPGQRRHAGCQDLRPIYNGQGIAVVTTSKGLMTDFSCREQKIGGEVICHVW